MRSGSCRAGVYDVAGQLDSLSAKPAIEQWYCIVNTSR
jgi:hypothetical protein